MDGPAGIELISKPCRLTLRILPRGDNRTINSFFSGHRAFKVRSDFTHTDGFHRWQSGVQIKGQQCLDLVDRAIVPHQRKSLRDAL